MKANKTLKAISLWEPWASFMGIGVKRNETRSWCTGHRGELVICAAQKRMKRAELPDIVSYWLWKCRKELGAEQAESSWEVYLSLAFGRAVCVVDLKDCEPTGWLFNGLLPGSAELDLGNYSLGRWVWKTENCRALITPVEIHGRQSVWNLTEEEAAGVRGAMALPESVRLDGKEGSGS